MAFRKTFFVLPCFSSDSDSVCVLCSPVENMGVLMQDSVLFMLLQDQLGRVTLLSGILFIMLGLGTDSAPSLVFSRTPPPSVLGLPNLPTSLDGYSYVVMKFGPLQLTRKGLSTASTSACLTFVVSVFFSYLMCVCLMCLLWTYGRMLTSSYVHAVVSLFCLSKLPNFVKKNEHFKMIIRCMMKFSTAEVALI